MTRKHFDAIAKTLNEQWRQHPTKARRDVMLRTIEALSWELRAFNSHFDRMRFIEACTKES